ncbi:unnamed protein product [Eruca vesicaria subsp. sativa]|uniref:Uncharacterized protein n=1 Tax=Eruca vesicaria subsp. sativa TaxID=29727 RepID=A0ABC8KCR2_ERUVS|nr:unnamed protein product [Eruca vesicaria subsp. sativa]
MLQTESNPPHKECRRKQFTKETREKTLPDPIPEVKLQAVVLDAGKAFGHRRRVLLPVFDFVLLRYCLLVVFGYCFRLLAVSYGSCPMVLLEASHTRSVRLFVPAESTLGSQMEPPMLTAAIVLPTLILGAAPPCESTTTGSFLAELRLARSRVLCRSKTPPPLLVTFTYNKTPSYCIATLSKWSPDSSTISISNRCLSPNLDICLAGPGPVVYLVFVTSPAHQYLYGDNPHRENLLTSSANSRLHPPRPLLRPYPGAYKRHPSTGFMSPIGRGEADPSSENGAGELLLNKTLFCSLLVNSWAWVWLHLLGHSSNLRGFKALRSYWIFISKPRHFRRMKPQFHGSIPQHPPNMPAIMLDSVSNSPMESERKRASTTLSFRLPIVLLSGPFEIHLVSRYIIDGCRAGLFRLTGYLAYIGSPPLFQPLSLGYFNVFSDYLELLRAAVPRIQVKIIYGSLYFKLVSPCNTSIPCFTALLLLLFILPSRIPPVVIVETL